MLNLKVTNKAVIKSTWKEQPCQKERQRHKSLSLFNGLCPFIGGRQPWRLLASVPSAQHAGFFISPVMKRGRRATPTRCTKNAGSGPGPAMEQEQEPPLSHFPAAHGGACSTGGSCPAPRPQPGCRLAGGSGAGRATPLLRRARGGMTSPGEASQLIFSPNSLLREQGWEQDPCEERGLHRGPDWCVPLC